MRGGPDLHHESGLLERGDGGVAEPGLELHAPAGNVQPRARDGFFRSQAFVEDASRHLE